jgi:Protein of unknown function DUF262/Protein of unknown function (DUF1524)
MRWRRQTVGRYAEARARTLTADKAPPVSAPAPPPVWDAIKERLRCGRERGHDVKEIRGEAKTLRQLLSGSRYGIDYYQREYRWQTRQVRELLEDLSEVFLDYHAPGHDRVAVQDYGHYFLGSVILSRRGNDTFIIDGQQRLTTLSLLLIFLHDKQGERPDRVKLDELIFSEKFGRKSFNIEVEERAPVMEALYSGQQPEGDSGSESLENIIQRYRDIEELFDEDITDSALPYFADWLIENVHLVEIVAQSDEDAYTIFETMNDRGLSLTPLDMLKGYVLANITDGEQRSEANDRWKKRVSELQELGKEEDADGFKAWLRSQYAQTIRERKRNAQPGDFDRLGTEFHRWVKEHDEDIGLKTGADFATFVGRDMRSYTQQYLRLRRASEALLPGLESVFFNARLEFTLQYPLLLAPLLPEDENEVIDRKLRVAAAFVDILIARRLWNFRSIAYSTMQYAMFLVMRDIRRRPVDEIVEILHDRLVKDDETFAQNDRYGLHQMNRRQMHFLLARMTDYVETGSGLPSRFMDYVAEGKNRFEIEHIWADHADRHEDEFVHPSDFAEYRNRIGDLLLLPKSFNASYGDLAYEEKLPHYFGQNLLAKSLDQRCYEHNPGFLDFVRRDGLPFRPHAEFKKADVDARQELYGQIAEKIWRPERLFEEAGLSVPTADDLPTLEAEAPAAVAQE